MPVKVYDGTNWVTVAGDGQQGAAGTPATGANLELTAPTEITNTTTSVPTATQAIDFITAGTWYFTGSNTSNMTINIRGNGGTTLNSLLAIGESATVALMVTNGGTAYYANVIQVDGSTVTPKWSGGTAPTAGNASSIDIYSFTVIKTAATPTYTVFAAGPIKYA
jgi:hypothetical protein